MQTVDQRLVVVLGSGRSGTTLIGKIFDSSPDTLYLHEPDKILVNRCIPFLPSEHDSVASTVAMARYLERLTGLSTYRTLGSHPVFEKSFRTARQSLLFRLWTRVGRAGSGLGRDVPLPALMHAGRPDVVVLKSVSSLARAGIFAAAAPAARIVHVVRHPCGVVASWRRGVQAGLMPGETFVADWLATPVGTELFGSEARYRTAAPEIRAALGWTVTNEIAHRALRGRQGCALVRYEDLCSDIGSVTERLFRHGGLAAGPQTEAFLARLASAPETSRYFSVLRKPSAGPDRWRAELGAWLCSAIEELAARSTVGRIALGEARPWSRQVPQ